MTGRGPLPEARVLRGTGKRLDGFAHIQAARIEPKTRPLGAGERDEFLWAAWRALVVAVTHPGWLVLVDEMDANASLSPLYAGSPRGERKRLGVNVTMLWWAWAPKGWDRAWQWRSDHEGVSGAYLAQVLAPSPRPEQVGAMGRALDAVTAGNVHGFFEHRGLRAAAQLPRQVLQRVSGSCEPP